MTGIYRTGRFANVDDETIGRARTNNDVAAIVDQMYVDLREHPREWENYTVESYLDALSRSREGLRSLYCNRGESLPEPPTWELFAEVLVIATGYE